ncbi:cytochrome c family protein [Sphingobium sp. H33]|uniref:Cytochrome c family protein n=2 Tax=Sphingobium nicotianae TaxID=2782607 RepID=A0A9X1DB21_9SPHN|nr:cytochrome c family protein [Sphingobium nicotianae]
MFSRARLSGALASATVVAALFGAFSAQDRAIAAPAAAPAGNAANGAKLFAQCKICHSTDAGKNGLGPSLRGVVGRKSATAPGFSYSTAMKGVGVTWKPHELNEFLRGPMKKIPGTKMAFAGIANDQNRADVIAYLGTLK